MESRSISDDNARPTANENDSTGPQGVDKAPGEEPAFHTDQFTQETQKGKKVDADPLRESNRPVEQSNL